MSNVIKFKKLSEEAVIPKRETDGSVGMDLSTTGKFDKGTNNVYYWKTGLSVEPPEGCYFEIHPRSSLHKKGWMLVNSTGIIDTDYRGELIVPLLPIYKNITPRNVPFTNSVQIEEHPTTGGGIFGEQRSDIQQIMLEPKTRIAQLILRKNELVGMDIKEMQDLTNTKRGSGGFGSTDIEK